MPDIILPNLSLELPDIGADQDTWGDILNADLMKLDAVFSLTGTPVSLSSVSVATLAATGAISAGSISTANATITGGSINNTTIGASIRAIGNFTNLDYTGTLTGGTGVINIGMGQIFKDAAGRVGIGTTAPTDTLTLQGTVAFNLNGVTDVFKYFMGDSGLVFVGTTTNTAIGLITNGAERLRLDPAGNAGLGVVPSAWGGGFKVLQTLGGAFGSNDPVTNNYLFQNVYFDNAFRYFGNSQASYLQQANGSFRFLTAPSGTAGAPITFTQAMTLTQAGNLLVGAITDQLSTVVADAVGRTYSYVGLNNGTQTYRVLANGNVQNTNNSYGAISDAKLKENVVDVSSYLDRFMQVRFRNFNFIGSDLKQFGVIAQELEQVFPGLVDESPDFEQVTKTRIVDVPAVLDEEGVEVTPATTREEEYTESVPTGTVTKSVKYSILAQIQGKVIQEQQALIQDLAARVAALEAK